MCATDQRRSYRGGSGVLAITIDDGGEWQDITERVPVNWIPCIYGGCRPLFRCPGVLNGVLCNRRGNSELPGSVGPDSYCRHLFFRIVERLRYRLPSGPTEHCAKTQYQRNGHRSLRNEVSMVGVHRSRVILTLVGPE